MNSDRITNALRKRYAAPAYAYFSEVADGTGSHQSRWADGLAMSLYPSRGLEMHGFEIKCYRGDWLNELKNPAKAEKISQYCDRWWIVTPDSNPTVGQVTVVQPGELPPTWGLMVVNGRGCITKVEAPKLKAKPIDRFFFAALCRSVSKHAPGEAMLKAARAEAREEGKQWQIEQDKHEPARMELDKLRASLAEFQQKSGIEIDRWNGGHVGEQLKLLQYLRLPNERELIERAAGRLETAAAGMREMLIKIPA